MSPSAVVTAGNAVLEQINSIAAPLSAIQIIATAQAAIQALGTLQVDDGTVLAALNLTSTALVGLLSIRDATETDLNAISARAAPGGLVASAADLTQALADMGALATVTQAEGYMGRVSINLGGGPWV